MCNQSSFACNFNATHKHGEVMASDLNEQQQTQLAAEILTLFHRANLTARKPVAYSTRYGCWWTRVT